MDLGLHNHVVMVTGGTDGLGLALARRLLDEGARVGVCGRDPERLRAAGALDPDRVEAVRADVRDPGDLAAFVTAVADRFGRIDGVVNNAGSHASGPFAALTDEAWQADLDLKLHHTIRTSRLALDRLRERGGAIVNVLNLWAKTPDAGTMPTSVSRAAQLAVTKALSRELAGDGVRVNAILVGFVESGQWRRLAAERGVPVSDVAEEFVDTFRIPMGRIGRPEEFADLAAFLLSPRAGYVSGAAVNLDGALCAVV
jgi:NAD(P)-dependent dehydrogenase (short-subunit alcohol dehydrogenase family)